MSSILKAITDFAAISQFVQENRSYIGATVVAVILLIVFSEELGLSGGSSKTKKAASLEGRIAALKQRIGGGDHQEMMEQPAAAPVRGGFVQRRKGKQHRRPIIKMGGGEVPATGGVVYSKVCLDSSGQPKEC